jgi:peptidoglycan/LPS O-acetylase OafA/YrhL
MKKKASIFNIFIKRRGWIKDKGYTFAQALPQALMVFVISYAALKLYDEPVRNWLKRF